MKRNVAGWRFALLLAVVAGGFVPDLACGAVFAVTKEVDDNGPCTPDDCALREAVLAADALLGADVVHVPPGTYALTLGREESIFFSGELDIEDDLEIVAPSGAVIVGSGTSNVPIFRIHGATVRLDGLTVTGGRYCCGAAFSVIDADVVLERCWITGNEATSDSGGIEFLSGRLEILNSTISGNTAERRGGAIQRSSFGSTFPAFLIVRNSTISGNSAREGGAISSFGGGGDIRIENSTIVGNPVRNFGSVIFTFSGTRPTFVNSLLEGDCYRFQTLPPISEGGNVAGPGETFCNLDHPTDLPAQPNLGLLPLGNYGGPTPTHALSPTSPAIDRALAAACPDADQRGRPRPVDGNGDGTAQCDAGAFELQGADIHDIPALSLAAALTLAGLLAIAGMATLGRS